MVALQPQARDPFSNLVAGTGGAAARDMQPFQDRRAGSGIGQTLQAAAKPAPPEVQKGTSVLPVQS